MQHSLSGSFQAAFSITQFPSSIPCQTVSMQPSVSDSFQAAFSIRHFPSSLLDQLISMQPSLSDSFHAVFSIRQFPCIILYQTVSMQHSLSGSFQAAFPLRQFPRRKRRTGKNQMKSVQFVTPVAPRNGSNLHNQAGDTNAFHLELGHVFFF